MRRRPFGFGSSKRTTLTYTVLQNARHKLNKLQNNVIDATCEFPPISKREFVSWLFDEEKLALIKAATPYLSSKDDSESFTLDPHLGFTVMIRGWRDWGMNAPNGDALQIKLDKAQPIFDYVHATRKVLADFAMARHVLEWMDEYATPGAIKYYWPSVLSLCDAEVVRNATERFQEPAGISLMLGLCRQTANTVAMGILAPEKKVQASKGVSLWFSERQGTWEGHQIRIESHTEEIIFPR